MSWEDLWTLGWAFLVAISALKALSLFVSAITKAYRMVQARQQAHHQALQAHSVTVEVD